MEENCSYALIEIILDGFWFDRSLTFYINKINSLSRQSESFRKHATNRRRKSGNKCLDHGNSRASPGPHSEANELHVDYWENMKW